MNPYAPSFQPRYACPHGRYLQALGAPELVLPAAAQETKPKHPVRPDVFGSSPLAEPQPLIRVSWHSPWKTLVRYFLFLVVGLGLIYLAYRYQLTQHILFPVVVGIATVAALVGMFMWGLRQERLAQERRRRLRLEMARAGKLATTEENPAHPLYEHGMELVNMGEFEEAIVYFRKALQINNRYVEAYQALGTAYNALGEPELAVEMTQRAFEIKVQGYGEKLP